MSALNVTVSMDSTYFDDSFGSSLTYGELHTSLHDPFTETLSSCQFSTSVGRTPRRHRRLKLSCQSPDVLFDSAYHIAYSSPVALKLQRISGSRISHSNHSILNKAFIDASKVDNSLIPDTTGNYFKYLNRPQCEGDSDPTPFRSRLLRIKVGSPMRLKHIPKSVHLYPECANSKRSRNSIRRRLKDFHIVKLTTLAMV